MAITYIACIIMFLCHCIKIGELETTQPFSNDDGLLKLVRMCLQVNSKERPSASQAQHYLVAAR